MKTELEKRVKKYHSLTEKALAMASIKKGLSIADEGKARQLLKMAKDYFSDAEHFERQGKLSLALAAFSYAHAWLDAGVRIGLLDGKNNDQLFTLP